jgi:hypothetical protein
MKEKVLTLNLQAKWAGLLEVTMYISHACMTINMQAKQAWSLEFW